METEVHKRKSIPLIRFNREDLALRQENLYALALAGLKTNAPELLYMNDLPESETFPFDKFALVDHNRIGSSFVTDNPTARVVAVVDHHQDEGLYQGTANPRIIDPIGSCSSIVAKLCPPSSIPKEIATLLLCAIAIDTGGLEDSDVADVEAVALLAPLSTIASSFSVSELDTRPSMRRLATELAVKKLDVSHLSVWDLLRRDYKEYTFQLSWLDPKINIKAGLSTIPLSIEYLLNEGKLENQLKPWMQSRGLTVHGILTTYWDKSKSERGKHVREQLWIVYENQELALTSSGNNSDQSGMNALTERLFSGLKASGDLHLKRKTEFDVEKVGRIPGVTVRVYNQKNTSASRKVTAPTLKKILESPGPLPKVLTIWEDN